MAVLAFFRGFAPQFGLALLMVVVCVAIERIAPAERFSMRQRWLGFVILTTGTCSSAFLAWALQSVWAATGIGAYVVIPVYDWLRPLGSARAAVSVFVSLAAFDFFTYWRHRAEHRWFWPIHAAHHSPAELHAVNNWSHPLAVIPGFLFVSVPVSLIQMPGPAVPAIIGGITAFLGSYIHSSVAIDFGPLRRVLVDNRFHRIHHSTDPRHVDHNFAALFSFWDALFGTAYWPAKNEWPKVGIDREQPRTLGAFLLYPLPGPSTVDELAPSPR